ncbi:MAG: D-alanine--D-alanine ligase family protein [Actinomycetaceae bacterium]|nr:D-alanine--D-alanine ligase [Actinomycetaceae bacterium]MDY6083321.1 D-alanine--D-alanine ligase family protein [Actinomycetaceae bacterium]
MADNKVRVALVYGGMSGEHSVSCVTAASVITALNRERFDVVPVGITRSGHWVPGSMEPTSGFDNDFDVQVPESDASLMFSMDGQHHLLRMGSEGYDDLGAIDVVFPLLHGPFGEDGTIQGLFEMAQVPYVGCGVLASSAGMDKVATKVMLEAQGIPVAPYISVSLRQWTTDEAAVRDHINSTLRYPLFVKPARAGSSLGISKVHDESELASAMEKAGSVDPKILVETGLSGHEIECGVLGGLEGSRPRASVLGEIVKDGAEWYDYETKYWATENYHMEIPARVSDRATAVLRDVAVRVFEILGCEGLARVDFFLTDSGQPVVNEVNTMPGFTAFSMYPILWEKTGVPYTDLVSTLIDLACSRPLGLR